MTNLPPFPSLSSNSYITVSLYINQLPLHCNCMRVRVLSPQGPWTQDYVISTIIRTNKRKEKVTTTVVVNQVECPQAKSQLRIFQTILLQIQTPDVLTIKEDKEMEKKTSLNPEVVWDLYENCHLAEFRGWPNGFAAIEYSDDIDNPKSS